MADASGEAEVGELGYPRPEACGGATAPTNLGWNSDPGKMVLFFVFLAW